MRKLELVESDMQDVFRTICYDCPDEEYDNRSILGYMYFYYQDGTHLIYHVLPYTEYKTTHGSLIIRLTSDSTSYRLKIHKYWLWQNGIFYRTSFLSFDYEANRVYYEGPQMRS